jgi:hypothetical protein
MSRHCLPARPLALAAALFTLLLAGTATGSEGRLMVSNPMYRAECGSCHVAYPPALLPATAWDAILADLARHFGTDASVEGKALDEIRTFLQQHAPKGPSGAPATLRITETRWFLREHDDVLPAVWRGPAVKTPANCGACHRRAVEGDYSERGILVPR